MHKTETEIAKWMDEARRYADHIYCYDIVTDHHDTARENAKLGANVYQFVEWAGEQHGLDRADQDWGINTGKVFHRAFAYTA